MTARHQHHDTGATDDVVDIDDAGATDDTDDTGATDDVVDIDDAGATDHTGRKGARRLRVLGGKRVAGIAAMVGMALIGGVVGGVIVHAAGRSAPASLSAEELHATDVGLCTQYVNARASAPNPIQAPLQVLTVVNGLRLALADNPNASPQIRQAITDVIGSYDALISSLSKTPPRGLYEPPSYDRPGAQQAANDVLTACALSG